MHSLEYEMNEIEISTFESIGHPVFLAHVYKITKIVLREGKQDETGYDEIRLWE